MEGKMILSEDLKHWRAERPDEWTMDDFIRKAKALEEASDIKDKIIETQGENIDALKELVILNKGE
jgi:hypothetical protein